MAIITKPNTVVRGTPSEFTLSKTELVSSIIEDVYFQDTENWFKVIIRYVSDSSNQYEVVEFDAASATPIGTFLASPRSLGNFEVQYIQIIDFDGGTKTILRPALDTVQFDVAVSEPNEPNDWGTITNDKYIVVNNQLTSTILPLTTDPSNAIYLEPLYTRGLETEVIFNLNENFFSDRYITIGVATNTKGQISGIYDNAFGVNGPFVNSYPLLTDSKTEFKMILTPTETRFYIDGELKQTLGAVTLPDDEFYVVARFPEGSILESYSVRELPVVDPTLFTDWDVESTTLYSINESGQLVSSFDVSNTLNQQFVYSRNLIALGDGVEITYKISQSFIDDTNGYFVIQSEDKSYSAGVYRLNGQSKVLSGVINNFSTNNAVTSLIEPTFVKIKIIKQDEGLYRVESYIDDVLKSAGINIIQYNNGIYLGASFSSITDLYETRLVYL